MYIQILIDFKATASTHLLYYVYGIAAYYKSTILNCIQFQKLQNFLKKKQLLIPTFIFMYTASSFAAGTLAQLRYSIYL